MELRSLAVIAALAVGLSSHAAHAVEGHNHGTESIEVIIDVGRICTVLEQQMNSSASFERTPKTEKEKVALSDAARLLNDTQAAFIPSAKSNCSVSQYRLQVEALQRHEEALKK